MTVLIKYSSEVKLCEGWVHDNSVSISANLKFSVTIDKLQTIQISYNKLNYFKINKLQTILLK